MTVSILLDVDGVLANFAGGLLASHKTKLRVKDLTKFDFLDELDFDAREVIGNGLEFCKNLPLYPGAKRFVRKLQKLGRVDPLTAPFHGASLWRMGRSNWLAWHFDLFAPTYCPTEKKHLVPGNVLIEDNLETVIRWSATQRRPAILIDRPWNRHFKVPYRAHSYKEALAMAKLLIQ